MKNPFRIALMLFLMSTPVFGRPAAIDVETAIRLNLDNASSEAHKAVVAGDERFLAVMGYSIETPGVDSGSVAAIVALRKRHGIRIIKGTSDTGDLLFNERATRYARIWNGTILRLTAKPH